MFSKKTTEEWHHKSEVKQVCKLAQIPTNSFNILCSILGLVESFFFGSSCWAFWINIMPLIQIKHKTDLLNSLSLEVLKPCYYLELIHLPNFNNLKECKLLQQLTLILTYYNIGNEGAKALVGLKECKILQQLTLNLGYNNIGDEGAKALSGFKEYKILQQLTLNLGYNNIGDEGVKALSGFKECKNLQQLTLDLRRNNIGDEGAKALAKGLEECQQLQQLTLTLRYNNIKYEGTNAIVEFKERNNFIVRY